MMYYECIFIDFYGEIKKEVVVAFTDLGYLLENTDCFCVHIYPFKVND